LKSAEVDELGRDVGKKINRRPVTLLVDLVGLLVAVMITA
jgi:hypothetical protein